MVRLAVAEDNLLVREGIVQLLSGAEGVEVVAVCADPATARAAVEERRVGVVVTDIRMPPSRTDEGIRLAADLRESHPDVGVVVLSQYAEPEYALRLFERGSDGRAYLLKDRVHDRGELVGAIVTVASGGSVVDARIVDGLVAANAAPGDTRLASLTPRERQVLGEIAQGKSNSAIAESLVLTKRAVEKHINAIFLKLGLAFADDVSKRVKAALLFLAEADVPGRGG